MKKLKEKIVKKVYSFETKKIVLELIIRTGSIIIVVSAAILFIVRIVQQLFRQQTLDILQIFQEDSEIIKSHLNEITDTLYQEFPKYELLLVIIFASIGILLILFFILNFEKIKNRIIALKKYWLERIH